MSNTPNNDNNNKKRDDLINDFNSQQNMASSMPNLTSHQMNNTPNNDNNNKKRDDNDLINDFNSQQNMASSMPNLTSHQMNNTPNNDNNNKKRDDNDLINDFNSQQNMASSMPNLISHQMNNTLNNDNNNKKLHIWVRKGWKHGSKVNVYSHTATQWATGTVERQFQDDEGEWLEIKYSINNKVRFKQIQRYNNHIRPWQPIMPICIYIYDAITVPTINTSQLQLLDAYSNTSNGSRKSRKYESRRPSHAIPNEIHSPTTHENINYCDEDEIVTVYNENNNINIIFHPEKRDDLCAQQDINKCLSAQRLKYILDTNNNYSDKIDIMMKTLDNIFKQYDYTNTSLLDDFNHVKYYNHNNKEEEIDDFEFNKIFTYFTNFVLRLSTVSENYNINIIFQPEKRDDLCAQQDINKCLSAQRLKYILDTNNNYSDKIDIMMKTLDNIFKQYDYTNTSLLDDFNHVKYYNHNNKEEEIDDFEFNKIFTYFTNFVLRLSTV
eukprot:394383_1